MFQPFQCLLFDSRNIRAGDAQLVGNLLLCIGFSVHQAVSHADDSCLPSPQTFFRQHANALQTDAPLHLAMHLTAIRAQNVDERNFVSLSVNANRLLQGHVAPALLACTQTHEDLVFNAPRTIGAELCP